MRKYIVVALLAVLVLGIAAVSFAADDNVKCPMMAKGDKGGMICMCPMHGMMMKSAIEKEMVATEDGNIVVMAGNKLMKYDKNLNLLKETEIKTNAKEICDKMCKEMCADCPMCQGMMNKPEMKQSMPAKK
jgi:hypothetical protein